MENSDPILFDVDADTGVALLTLNRPQRFNAFTQDMIDRWHAALQRVEREPQIRAVVITGAGKAFCAGGDMDELESFIGMNALERKLWLWEHVHRIPLLLEGIDKPVIAALNGTARGAGLDMALMCDLRIVDASVQLAESYISVGLVPGDGGSWFLPRLVGIPRALEMLWTGDPIDARTALQIGLVNRVTEDGQALPAALALAAKIARQPQQAIRFTKRAVYQSMAMSTSLRSHLDTISSQMAVLEDLPDFRDRVRAFKDRKAPRA
ncbi:MAG: enoyl-CoA hydratase/isomerase family protein [Gammaproteobacteria bacterium]